MISLVPSLLRFLGPCAALTIAVSVVLLVVFLTVHGLSAWGPALFFGETPPLAALFGHAPVWNGIWPACAGTLCLVALTLLLALAPGIGCGLYLAWYAAPQTRRRINLLVDILAGMPSIIMGLFGFAFIILLRRTIAPQANTGLLLSAACLALLVLPVLVAATREAVCAVPPLLNLSGAALGLSPGQRLRHIILPAAAPGIRSGVILALARAAEDTAVIMFTGVVANAGLPAGPLEKFEALPFFIYYTAAQYQDAEELARGFGAALALLALSVILLLGARLLRWRSLTTTALSRQTSGPDTDAS